jgi:hypothetical protein
MSPLLKNAVIPSRAEGEGPHKGSRDYVHQKTERWFSSYGVVKLVGHLCNSVFT